MSTIKRIAPSYYLRTAFHGSMPEAGRRRGLFSNVLTVLLRWQDRAEQRQALASLDEHQLRDVGLSRADVKMEASKPFWRA